MRGSVYVAMLVSVIIAWFMKQYDNKRKARPETSLDDIEIDNPLEALKDANWAVRLKAIQQLPKMPSEEAIPHLIAALGDEDSDVREAAADALASYEEESIPQLLKILENGNPDAREAAVKALAKIGSDKALKAVGSALLDDESAWVRIAAAKVLGQRADKRYVKVLTESLEDSHADVYEAAVEALKQIGTKEALLAVTKHPYHSVA